MVAFGHSAAARHPVEGPLRASEPRASGVVIADTRGHWPARPIPAPHRASPQEALSHAIESAVLPRLLLTHAAAPGRRDLDLMYGVVPGPDDVTALYDLLVVDNAAGAAAQVEALRARGTTLQRLFLDLLAPAARLLGQAWEEDRCDFSTVTLGTLRLQHLLRDYGPAFEQETRLRAARRRILLVNPPGEQHSFGRDMVAGFFRHAGWDVWDQPPRTAPDLVTLVRREAFAVIGFSAGATDRLDLVATGIRAVRRASRNGAIGVMVGGPLFAAHPEYVALVGADATASDGQQATLQAERLLALLARRD